ncbi:MAG: peptidoglycan-binding protein LysM [Chitinophagales bacterium]
MGLISFVKNAGAKLFNRKPKTQPSEEVDAAQAKANADAQKAIELENAIKDWGINIDGLYVEVNDDVAIVSGTASSLDDREKAVLICGNVAGIASVDDRITVFEAEEVEAEVDAKEGDDRSIQVPLEPASDYYTVVRGDSLSKIAKVQYGDALKYPIIFEANRPMLKDPDLIYPGQVLRIPSLG